MLIEFTKEKHWFPICLKKMNISPNIKTLDITEELQKYANENYKLQKEKECEKEQELEVDTDFEMEM